MEKTKAEKAQERKLAQIKKQNKTKQMNVKDATLIKK